MTQGVLFITSGAKGLGHATVRCFLAAGWDVCFTYGQSEKEAQWLLEEARQMQRSALAIHADLLDPLSVQDAVNRCLSEFSRVDAFVHNFGPFIFERMSLADYEPYMWDKMMNGNLHNFYWIYRLLIPGMRQRAFGRVVTMGYDGAENAAGWRFRAAYAAAKAGLASLTRSIAREERQNGITANMVCPGDIRGSNKMKLIDEVGRVDDPLSRPPVGEDVARMILFLCEEQSQQVNGTITEVTGGYDILLHDDGTDMQGEKERYRVGDEVWVYPWQKIGVVRRITKIPNRNVVYEVVSSEREGSFTMYQLSEFSPI